MGVLTYGCKDRSFDGGLLNGMAFNGQAFGRAVVKAGMCRDSKLSCRTTAGRTCE
jgi:hypothetical protein